MKTPNPATGAPPATASEGVKRSINVELWQACAGPLVNLPAAGTHVVYFPQGHSEQVAASLKKDVDAQIPNYPNLPPKLLCLLHNVTMHADPDTDEVYAQMTLQPVPSFDKEALVRSDVSMRVNNKPQTEFFCKTLTASDTSTHGGFSVPRRAAEKMFPPLDFSMQPPAQELVARDLHNNLWTFRHIFRGQPKRHLLTTGWSLFVSGKTLMAGDSVLFIRDEKQQLLLGIRGANRQPTNLSSSVLSTDSMHIGILAAAAHAAANNSPFTVFYNPRASLSEFVIPLAKYYKAVCSNQISLGMRFRMMFETEESGTRRYMGTITGIGDLDPVRWKNSQWRNLQVGWDESTAGQNRNRVSIWEIEPVTAPFFICPTPLFFRPKRPRLPGMPDDDESSDLNSLFRRTDEFGLKDPQGLSLAQWMNMQQNPSLSNSIQTNYTDISRQLGVSPSQISYQQNLQFNAQRATQPLQQIDHLQKLPSSNFSHLGSIVQPQNQLTDVAFTSRQTLVGHPLQASQLQSHILQSQNSIQSQNNVQQQQQQSLVNHHQLQRSLSQNQSPQQQQIWNHAQQQQQQQQQQILNHAHQQQTPPSHERQQLQVSDSQIQLQLLQKLNHQQQSFQDQQKQLLEIPPNFSVSTTTSQMLDSSQVKSTWFSQSPQQPKHQQQQQQETGALPELHGHAASTLNPITNQLSADDVPSCSTSQSMSNFMKSTLNGRNYCATTVGDEIAQSSATLLSSSGLEHMSSNGKGLQQKSTIKPSLIVSKSQNQGFFASQTYLNAAGTQIDYLDTSSSVTSVHGDHLRNNVPFVASIDNQLDMPIMSDPLIAKDMVGLDNDYSNNVSSGGGMLENTKEAQPELSSSFGLPDITFNSIDSTMNDGSFMNGGAWAPPQIPKKRTYTKVYKRGAVGRSIDVTRYSGYDELIQDLARRFGIEGQLEDKQRIGWKLVYVDHENDVLLVGDDPWEEFVNCVRCIKILSPQEVQQMSLDGDFGNSVVPNQACSSSDN